MDLLKDRDAIEARYKKTRLLLALRKCLLGMASRECYRSALPQRWPWASKELFDEVVTECLREGLLTERQGKQGATILTWHEEKVHED